MMEKPKQTPPASPTPISLQQPSKHEKNPSKALKIFRRVHSVFRTLPIMSPACRIPTSLHGSCLGHDMSRINGGTRITGTLFGYRKARVNLVIQENPRCLPIILLELAIPTGKLLQDMGMGFVRIALECEKHLKTKILEEPLWTLYCNGRKSGYGLKREPTEEDLNIMQMLHAVSMGAGVLPIKSGDQQSQDDQLMYMRAHFGRVVGSKDSETYYMINPEQANTSGGELSIFFFRI